MERFTNGSAFKERCNGNIPYAEIINFVSKVEDFMEEQGFENLDDLKKYATRIFKSYEDAKTRCQYLNGVEFSEEQVLELVKLSEFNNDNINHIQRLKNRWNKLKEIVSVELDQDSERRYNQNLSEFAREMYDNFTCVEEWVLGQMQELENVSDTNVSERGKDNNVATKEDEDLKKSLRKRMCDICIDEPFCNQAIINKECNFNERICSLAEICVDEKQIAILEKLFN